MAQDGGEQWWAACQSVDIDEGFWREARAGIGIMRCRAAGASWGEQIGQGCVLVVGVGSVG